MNNLLEKTLAELKKLAAAEVCQTSIAVEEKVAQNIDK
jgi:hypothetical protein